jgi:hypothetical protein
VGAGGQGVGGPARLSPRPAGRPPPPRGAPCWHRKRTSDRTSAARSRGARPEVERRHIGGRCAAAKANAPHTDFPKGTA